MKIFLSRYNEKDRVRKRERECIEYMRGVEQRQIDREKKYYEKRDYFSPFNCQVKQCKTLHRCNSSCSDMELWAHTKRSAA